MSPEAASPLVVGAPATTESDVQPPAGPDPAEPEVLGEPAELTERSDGKEPRVLEEVRNAHGHGNTAGKPETVPHLTPVAEPVQEPAHADQEDQRAHLQCLLSAAAIASATLICHRETWDFIAEHTSGHTHFRLPERMRRRGWRPCRDSPVGKVPARHAHHDVEGDPGARGRRGAR